MSESLFPAGFESLEPFAAEWALATEYERRAKRSEAPLEEQRRFYEAIMADWARVTNHLKAAPPYGLNAQTERLLHLAMMAMESGIAVKVFEANDSPLAADFRRLSYLHEA